MGQLPRLLPALSIRESSGWQAGTVQLPALPGAKGRLAHHRSSVLANKETGREAPSARLLGGKKAASLWHATTGQE